MVDDSPYDIDLISIKLKKVAPSITVDGAATAGECFEALRGGRYDLLLVDYELTPDLDGLELLRRIEADNIEIPVIFMTGWGSEEVAAEAFRHGAADYLIKDFGAAQMARLANTILNVVNQARAQEEKKQLRIQLERSEKRYRALIESAHDAIIGVDNEGNIRYANKAVEEILGYPPDKVMGSNICSFLVLTGESAGVDGALGSSLEKLDGQTVETEGLPGKGTRMPLEVSISRAEDVRDFQYVMVIRDITERKSIENELKQKHLEVIQTSKLATLGEMAAGIAHELNQPLNTTKIIANRLRRHLMKHPVDETWLSEKLKLIDNQVDRAALIIDHLREFGRKTDVRLSKVDVGDVLDGVSTILGEQLRLHGIEVKKNLPSDLPPVLAEKTRLEQVFLNLVTNARDALNAKALSFNMMGKTYKKSIEIKSSVSGDGSVVVEVSDNGCGMSKEVASKIFEPFFTTKEVGSGTGLGLSISYGILRDFGGGIDFKTAEGQGTTFRVTLPCASE